METRPFRSQVPTIRGMDFAAGTGTPIYAADSGPVIQASYSGNAGNLVDY